MRSSQELARLMKYDLATRRFIMEALNYIEDSIENILYSLDKLENATFPFEEIFRSVFSEEDSKTPSLSLGNILDICKQIYDKNFNEIPKYFEDTPESLYIKAWRNNSGKIPYWCTLDIPKQIYKKSWNEIRNEKIVFQWINILKHELEIRGFNVSIDTDAQWILISLHG